MRYFVGFSWRSLLSLIFVLGLISAIGLGVNTAAREPSERGSSARGGSRAKQTKIDRVKDKFAMAFANQKEIMSRLDRAMEEVEVIKVRIR